MSKDKSIFFKIIRKVKGIPKKAQNALPHLFITWGNNLKLPVLCAVGWRLALRKKQSISDKKWSRKKLIILSKSGGVQDIEAAYAVNNPDYCVSFLPRVCIKMTCRKYLGRKVTDLNYLSNDEELEKSKIEYRKFLEKVLQRFKALFGLSAVLQFNIVYYAERELAAACSSIGIPFVTAYKENLRSKEAWRKVPGDIKKNVGKYNGYKIAVYNVDAKNALIESGVVEPWQITVTGCARMDYSHRLRENISTRKKNNSVTIVYYMIVPVAGLTILFNEQELQTKNWNELIKKVNKTILNFAKSNNTVSIIAKGKTGYSEEQISDFGKIIPDNITIKQDGVGHDLLKQADVVIGFNTTAVLEAIAAGIPTIIPHIFSEKEKDLIPYAHEVCGAANCPITEKEFKEILIDLTQQIPFFRHLNDDQKETLNRLMGNPDGKAGIRLKIFLDDIILNTTKQDVTNRTKVV